VREESVEQQGLKEIRVQMDHLDLVDLPENRVLLVVLEIMDQLVLLVLKVSEDLLELQVLLETRELDFLV
ncbi:uncharacterized, partial [Tachysurus ichikawai]